jgi:hypothetical protein
MIRIIIAIMLVMAIAAFGALAWEIWIIHIGP